MKIYTYVTTIYMKTYTAVTYNLHEDLHVCDVQFTWRPTRQWRTIYMKTYTFFRADLERNLLNIDRNEKNNTV